MSVWSRHLAEGGLDHAATTAVIGTVPVGELWVVRGIAAAVPPGGLLWIAIGDPATHPGAPDFDATGAAVKRGYFLPVFMVAEPGHEVELGWRTAPGGDSAFASCSGYKLPYP